MNSKTTFSLFFLLFMSGTIAAQHVIDAGPNQVHCGAPFTAQLQGSAIGSFFSYKWAHNNAITLNTTATVNATTTYYLTGFYEDLTAPNLIVNGNFSAGNTGFTSSYGYAAPAYNALYPESMYTVSSRASNVHVDFTSNYDHTYGNASGQYMIVNGSGVPNTTIWQQTVNITPNTDYVFYTWVMSLVTETTTSVARLQFSVNNILMGSVFTAPLSPSNGWQRFYTTWNSGSASTAIIKIVNQNTNTSGNDFGLDDIYFAPMASITDSVKVTVVYPTDNTIYDTICLGANYPFGGNDLTPINPGTFVYDHTFNTTLGCDSVVHLYLSVLQPEDVHIYDTLCVGDTFRYAGIEIVPIEPGPLRKLFTLQLGSPCFSNVYISLEVGAKPEITHLVRDYPCSNQRSSIELTVIGGLSPYTYKWNTGATSSGIFSLNPATYSVSVSDKYGCASYDTVTIVPTGSKVEACFQVIYSKNNPNLPVTFVDCSMNATQYLWDFGDSSAPDMTDNPPDHIYPNFGKYTAILNVSDDYGCTDSMSQIITFVDAVACYFPNAFTPGGDNVNDIFKPICSNITDKDYLFEIFNRWGNKIFSSNHYERGWDGRVNGRLQSTNETFQWKVSYRDETNVLHQVTGFVTLVSGKLKP